MELFVAEYLQSQYFWTTVAFLVLLGVMAKFVVPVVTAILDARALQIQTDLDRAAVQRREAEEVLAGYHVQLTAARKESATILSKARAEAEALVAERMAQLEAEIARKSHDARVALDAAKAEALRDVRDDVAALALGVAEKVLLQSVDAKMAAKMTDEALKNGLN